jgi:hypothetical protein
MKNVDIERGGKWKQADEDESKRRIIASIA